MNKKCLSMLPLLAYAGFACAQTNYYLSSSGNDSNNGLSASTPWRTITRLNTAAAALSPGDSVLFHRGDIFRGEILPAVSGSASAPVYYGAYGTGAAPVINGAVPVTGWTSYSSNIWVADYTGSMTFLNNFFINDISQQVGRYPNANDANQGYLKIQSGSGATILNDNAISGQNWTGATAVVRVNLFLLNKPVVQSHSGSTLTFASPGIGNYTINAGYGYFLQNHLSTLDQQGEWYFDKTAKKIYLYSSADPNTFQTEAPATTNCFFATGKSYLNIAGLAFKNSNEYGVRIDSTAGLLTRGISIGNCDFSNCHNAVLVNRAWQVNVSGNHFRNTNNNAIFITAREYECSRNNIENTALRAGMGDPNNNQYNAINLVGRDATAQYNVIDSVGYAGIRFEGTRLQVKNNRISSFAMVKCDIGGIYSFKGFAPATYGYGANLVTGNIISAADPNLYGTTSSIVNANYACGIYMDNNSSGNLITGNTVYDVRGAGLMINITTTGHTVRNNTFFSNMYGFGYFPDSTSTIKDHNITRNIFYAQYLQQQPGVLQTSKKIYMSTMGTIDSNFYSQPFETDSSFVQTIASTTTPRVIRSLKLKEWNDLSFDANGVTSNNLYTPVTVNSVGSNRISSSNNSQFNTGLTTGSSAYTLWPASGTNMPAWDNTGQLDGGSLRLNLDDTAISKFSRVSINVGTVSYGKYYRLTFSAKANTDTGLLNIMLMAAATSNFGVCKFKTVRLSTSRAEVELLLNAHNTTSNAALAFAVNDPLMKVWIDNISFNELNVTEANPADNIRFEVNTDSTAHTVNLGSTDYKDVQGVSYSGTISLSPFSSLILQKQESALRQSATLPASRSKSAGSELTLFPNPPRDHVTIRFKAARPGRLMINISDAAGRKLLTESRNITEGVNSLRMNVSALKPGIYFVTVWQNAGIYHATFQK